MGLGVVSFREEPGVGLGAAPFPCRSGEEPGVGCSVVSSSCPGEESWLGEGSILISSIYSVFVGPRSPVAI